MDYAEQLQTNEWKVKRQEVIDLNWGMCELCMSSKNLNVHHKKYVKGHLAWQYPNSMLMCLCGKCHKEWHDANPIVVVDRVECIPELFQWLHRNINALRELDRRIAQKQKDNGEAIH